MKQIDEQLDALADDVQMQAQVAVLIFAGLRREELLWLTPGDIDLTAGKSGLIRIGAKTVTRSHDKESSHLVQCHPRLHEEN